MKTFPWALCTVLFIILFVQWLTKPVPVNTVPADQLAVVERKIADTARYYEQLQKASDAAIDEATAHAVQANEKLQQSNGELGKWITLSHGLQAKLDAAAKQQPDSTWVKVSPEFKTGCDSLQLVNAGLINQVGKVQQDNQSLVDVMNYEIGIRDSTIAKERAFNSAFQASLHDCIAAGRHAQKTGQPRYQVYAGIAAWGNQVNPLGGGEINLSLKTKTDQMYEVKGAVMLNTWWVGVGTKFKLHF